MRALNILFVMLALVPLLGMANATYNVTHINVHVYLQPNTSAHINETVIFMISNQSISQYQTDRIALNLTLSQWQGLIGQQLTEYIINPRGSIYNFALLPGPAVQVYGAYKAEMVLSYDVNNVTTVNQTSPRVFVYTMKPSVLNFEHGASGEILSPNATLNITIPAGSKINSVYPVPDYPPYGITNDYANVTNVAWFYGEPLSRFELVFQTNQSIRSEVTAFFAKVYQTLGIYSYIIVALVILIFILYVYYRAR